MKEGRKEVSKGGGVGVGVRVLRFGVEILVLCFGFGGCVCFFVVVWCL